MNEIALNQLAALGFISAGSTKAPLGTVVWSSSNGIGFGMSGQTMTASYTVPTQSVQPSIQSISVSNGRATTGEVVWSNANGIAFGINGNTITASYTVPVVPAQSVQPGIQSISVSNGRVTTGEVVWSNSNGIIFGVNGQTITASYTVPAQSNQTLSFVAVGNTTQNTSLTPDARSITFNGLGILSVGFNNGSVQLSVPAPAAQTNQSGNLYAVSNTTQSTSITVDYRSISFHGAGIASVGVSNGSVMISVPTVATVGQSVSEYDPFPALHFTNSGSTMLSMGTNTSATISFVPFSVEEYVLADYLNMVGSMSFITFGTSSARQSQSYSYGLYSRGTGTNNSTISLITSGSFSISGSYNNSSITLSHPMTTNNTGYVYGATNSAGVSISSGYTGLKLIYFPVKSTLAPGTYWLGVAGMNSSSNQSGGVRMSLVGGLYGFTNLAPIGSFSSAFSTGTNFAGSAPGVWNLGFGSWISANQAALPNTVALSAMSAGLNVIPMMKFWSTQ